MQNVGRTKQTLTVPELWSQFHWIFGAHSAVWCSTSLRCSGNAGDLRSGLRESSGLASHALVEASQDGKLVLQQWGYTVQNYSRFYRGTGYVEEMDRLNAYIKSNPDASYARFLRGYPFGYLGQTDAAIRDLNRALQLESPVRFGSFYRLSG